MNSSTHSSLIIAPFEYSLLQKRWVAHLLGQRVSELSRQPFTVSEEVFSQIIWGFKQLARGEPLAYLIGYVEFLGGIFQCDARALAPRPETEILAELSFARIEPTEGQMGWDLGCGTGVLGLSAKRQFPHLEITLSDLSKDALALACENAWEVEVSFALGDLFSPFKGKKAHCIWCNPPYLSREEYYAGHFGSEPSLALIGGDMGDEFYVRLAKEAKNYLYPGGQIFLEIGSRQGERVRELFHREFLVDIEKDWSGLDRFAFCLLK